MKVAVLGGASFSTPALFQAMQGSFGDFEFVLLGRSPRHLSHVARASRLLAGHPAPRITTLTCDPRTSATALHGADVVLIQMRIGNMPGRGFDESFPLWFGLCGDEGLGAGGVSAAWRSWPTIELWLQAIREHAPNALVLMMSSPVGILTRAAHQRFADLNCLGVCEVPYVTLREIAVQLNADFGTMSFEYFGVNHIGWLYNVRSHDRDLVREWADHPARRGFPSPDIIREWDGIPTKYLRLHFDAQTALESQRAAKIPRATELQSLQVAALAQYATASEPQLRQLLSRRDTPWYADSIVPLLRGLKEGSAPGPFFLSGPNQGYSGAAADDDILEIACRVEHGAIERIPLVTLPSPRIAELISQFCHHERVATDAVLRRQTCLLETAFTAHPWVARATAAEGGLATFLAEAVVAGNSRRLVD